jgi:hypothetical protein
MGERSERHAFLALKQAIDALAGAAERGFRPQDAPFGRQLALSCQ